MTIPTIFETCRPRADVLKGAITEADFAADLAQVIIGVSHRYCLPQIQHPAGHPHQGRSQAGCRDRVPVLR